MKNKLLNTIDIRNWTKKQSKEYLLKAEMTYLGSRGWEVLCGTSLKDKVYIHPNGKDRYSHEEAIMIQKNQDK